MSSTLALGLQALLSRQAKWILALVLVAVVALLAVLLVGPHLLSVAHGISFGSHPLACGNGDGGCLTSTRY